MANRHTFKCSSKRSLRQQHGRVLSFDTRTDAAKGTASSTRVRISVTILDQRSICSHDEEGRVMGRCDKWKGWRLGRIVEHPDSPFADLLLNGTMVSDTAGVGTHLHLLLYAVCGLRRDCGVFWPLNLLEIPDTRTEYGVLGTRSTEEWHPLVQVLGICGPVHTLPDRRW
jgi:hypothetical protein